MFTQILKGAKNHFLQTGAYAYNFLTQQLQHKNHGI